jgi:hypothetical protein
MTSVTSCPLSGNGQISGDLSQYSSGCDMWWTSSWIPSMNKVRQTIQGIVRRTWAHVYRKTAFQEPGFLYSGQFKIGKCRNISGSIFVMITILSRGVDCTYVLRTWESKNRTNFGWYILWHVNPLLGYATEVTQPASKHQPVNKTSAQTWWRHATVLECHLWCGW